MESSNQDNAQNQPIPPIKTTKYIYPQIYSFTIPSFEANKGSQKIGYTERKNVNDRIYEQTNTAAFSVWAEKQWSAPAFFRGNIKDFKDKDFHKFLVKKGIPKRDDLGTEWFYFNGTPHVSKELFDLFVNKGFKALQDQSGKIEYKLRAEQETAVKEAKQYFEANEEGEFLWNAKPRFGKTLASYDLAKRLNADKILIVTNRPAIANSWFDDYEQFISGYFFISSATSLKDRATLSREQYNAEDGLDKPQITFLSLQDLKGSKYFGGDHDKLRWVKELNWDLLIIDEAHEGVDTTRTDAAFNHITRKHTLHLSGTPFKAIANEKFKQGAIFNWTYLEEQQLKQAELEEGDESGDHADLPDLRLYTYRISEMTSQKVNQGVEIDETSHDFAFDLNEFFATKNQVFIHEEEVKQFLKNLTTNEKYPFSTPELRNELKHTFWYVGNRVESVKALEQLLKQDEIFKDYKVIVAAGDGRRFEEEEADFKANEKSFDRVKKAIAENDKTITLSCGQLTTGVTIKQWTAVLMLTDLQQPAQYMQAAFRAQNPYKFVDSNGQLVAKKSAYLFDFAPTRVLTMYEQFANALNPKAARGGLTESERKANVKQLLNFFPVISEDRDGKMVELDAQKVLTFPNALAAVEIVRARFMTNQLFNDNIKGVFQLPKSVEDILNKMPVEKNKRVEVGKKDLGLDDVKKAENEKETVINKNNAVALGQKIYGTVIDDTVDEAKNFESKQEMLDSVADTAIKEGDKVIAKVIEVNRANTQQATALRDEMTEKIRMVVADYAASDEPDEEALKAELKNVIETTAKEKITQAVEDDVENVKKAKEDEIRDRLRSFTRTIPMFIMANSSKEEITIDNFDNLVSDEDFQDLTNITKAEFHTLRDGFDYVDENGQNQHFGGVFDKYRFNASINEFIAEKKQRANYFENEDDIFELIPNQKNNQIFTPRNVVKMMIDSLEKESPELFKRTDSTFIDLYMKSGMYITEVVKKLFNNTRQHYNSDKECVKHILENQVYGLAPTGILYDITRSYIFGFDDNNDIDTSNFVKYDLLPNAKTGTAQEKLTELFRNGGEMIKFDAVVGNPPYQEEIPGRSEQPPVYNYFIDSAYDIADTVVIISPARFLFNVGKTPKIWNEKMLNDPDIKVLSFEQMSSKIFPNTDIKGGVVVTLRHKNSNFGEIGTFTHFKELNTILNKTLNRPHFISINEILYRQEKYNLDNIFDDYKEYKAVIGSDGKDRRTMSPHFTLLNKLYAAEEKEDAIKIIGILKNKRVWRYIDKKYINDEGNTNYYKVILPSSNGSGAIGEIISTPLIGEPLIGHTYSFISFGAYRDRKEAENNLKYIKSKYCRTLLGTRKITQGNKTDYVWGNVPLQDFTSSSDIDWSKSIPEIDQQLYKKYGLSKEEIDFIETHVKEMS